MNELELELRKFIAKNAELRLLVEEYRDGSRDLTVRFVLKEDNDNGMVLPEVVISAKIGI